VEILIAEASKPEKEDDFDVPVLSERDPVNSSVGAESKSLRRSAFDRLGSFLERVSFGEVMKGSHHISLSALASGSSSGAQPAMTAKQANAALFKGDQPDCVTLSTIHSAKGLEWRCVFGLHLCDGVFPK
jgi:superfamily I DNA/RNA helicase